MKPWPTPLPDWFWAWAEWRLGRGAYKGHGADPKWRPGNVPAKVPFWAWARLAALVGAPAPKPPPVPPPPKPTTDPALVRARQMLEYALGFSGFYLFGGGHGVKAAILRRSWNLDCSSSVSELLDAFGILGSDYVQVSGWFESYGASGRGKYVTIHANGEHVWIEFNIDGLYYRFDTSPHGDGGRGPRVRRRRRFDSGFYHRHPVGL